MARQAPIGDFGKSLTPQQELFEDFEERGQAYVRYAYRDVKGVLFQTTAGTLDAARRRRNKWLEGRRIPIPAKETEAP